jgi:hypothetical protein
VLTSEAEWPSVLTSWRSVAKPACCGDASRR